MRVKISIAIVAALALIATGALAGTASAHNGDHHGPPPSQSAYCVGSVNTPAYSWENIVDHISYGDAAANGGYYSYQVKMGRDWVTKYGLTEPAWYLHAQDVTFVSVTNGRCAVSTPPPPNNVFLCYSTFENDGGMVFTIDYAKANLTVVPGPTSTAGSYWEPLFMPGTPAGYPSLAAGTHLQCNGGTPTGSYFNSVGESVPANLAGVLGIYQVGK